MDVYLRKELKNIIDNNNKIIQAIDNDKNINIKKSIRACLISNNRLSKIMFDYLIDDEFEEPETFSKDSNSTDQMNKLKNIFGFK